MGLNLTNRDMFDPRDMPGFRRIEPADVPAPVLVHHIENL